MNKFEKTIELPVDDLKQRRELLEDELKKTIVELVTTDLKSKLSTEFDKLDLGKLTSASWEFHGEYDDEGGTAYYPSYIQLSNEEGSIDYEDEPYNEIVIKQKSKYSDYVYEYDIAEFLSDVLHEYSSELYDYGIEEILF